MRKTSFVIIAGALTIALGMLNVSYAKAQETLVVTPNGQVGIGTSTPAAPLHIYGSATADAWIGLGPSPAYGSGPSMNIGYGGASFGRGAGFINVRPDPSATAPNPSLRIGIADVVRMIINNTGSVGIGTTTPASKLHINGGDIRVSGGSFIDDGVTINAPDYVFDPSYALMPLHELKEFVSREKHLPNVPGAAEIKEQGVNLSQLQMRLLEKVEELTLYTLAQQEQLQVQQARIAELNSVNAELDARLAALEKAPSLPAGEQQP